MLARHAAAGREAGAQGGGRSSAEPNRRLRDHKGGMHPFVFLRSQHGLAMLTRPGIKQSR